MEYKKHKNNSTCKRNQKKTELNQKISCKIKNSNLKL